MLGRGWHTGDHSIVQSDSALLSLEQRVTQCDQCCSVEDGWRMSWDHCSVLTPQLQSLVSGITDHCQHRYYHQV